MSASKEKPKLAQETDSVVVPPQLSEEVVSAPLSRLEKIKQLNQNRFSTTELLKDHPDLYAKCTAIKTQLKARLQRMLDRNRILSNERMLINLNEYIREIDYDYDRVLARTIQEMDIINNPHTRDAFMKAQIPEFKIENTRWRGADGRTDWSYGLLGNKLIRKHAKSISLDYDLLKNGYYDEVEAVIAHELFHAYFTNSVKINFANDSDYEFISRPFDEGMTEYLSNLTLTTRYRGVQTGVYNQEQKMIDALFRLNPDAVRTFYVTGDWEKFAEQIAKSIETKFGKTPEEAYAIALEVREAGLKFDDLKPKEEQDLAELIVARLSRDPLVTDVSNTSAKEELIDHLRADFLRSYGNPRLFYEKAQDQIPNLDETQANELYKNLSEVMPGHYLESQENLVNEVIAKINGAPASDPDSLL